MTFITVHFLFFFPPVNTDDYIDSETQAYGLIDCEPTVPYDLEEGSADNSDKMDQECAPTVPYDVAERDIDDKDGKMQTECESTLPYDLNGNKDHEMSKSY